MALSRNKILRRYRPETVDSTKKQYSLLPLAASTALSLCLLCVSVTRRYCVKTAECKITHTKQDDISNTAVF